MLCMKVIINLIINLIVLYKNASRHEICEGQAMESPQDRQKATVFLTCFLQARESNIRLSTYSGVGGRQDLIEI